MRNRQVGRPCGVAVVWLGFSASLEGAAWHHPRLHLGGAEGEGELSRRGLLGELQDAFCAILEKGMQWRIFFKALGPKGSL